MVMVYKGIAPRGDLLLIERLGAVFSGKSFLHINSTREGGGVAEILHRAVPILAGLGIAVRWDVITGDAQFFEITKKIHNALQGRPEHITEEMWEYHSEINRKNAEKLDLAADCVFVHDPQPAALIKYRTAGTWMWRCHIDVSGPRAEAWEPLKLLCRRFDSAIFSIAKFAQAMPLPKFIIPPSIDPVSDKNRDLSAEEIRSITEKLQVPADRPVILQVSRFDRFKDPIGVINAYRLVKKYNDCVLVLAGSPATDDPEGAAVLDQVREYAAGDKDIMILLLPPFSDVEINALQRTATVVLQKSLKEGFGLTVSEAMWKEKPVLGGAVGGIPLQIVHGMTGFLVYSAEGAAFRIRQLLNNQAMAERMGKNGKEHVRNNFLITREVRDYLAAWYCILNKGSNILEV